MEIDKDATNTLSETNEKTLSFKKACIKVGLAMIVFFMSANIASIILALIMPYFENNDSLYMLIRITVMVIFAYIIPILSAKFIFKVKFSEMGKSFYKKPKYMAAALTLMPACYALSMLVNLLTQFISWFITRNDVNETAEALSQSLTPKSMTGAVLLFIYVAVCAPVFEELFFRGFLLNALRPYGNGISIFITGFLFGIFHGNYIQCFFAIAFGIVLAYIAIHTGSIITGMIIHAITNSLAGIIYLFMGNPEVQEYMDAFSNGVYLEPTGVVNAMSIYMYVLFTFIVISIIILIVKLKNIKKYSVPKVWDGISAKKRYAIFFSRISVIIMLIIALDTFTLNLIPTGGMALISMLVNH